MPSIDQIVEYWSAHQDECGLGVDWSEARERCWRCGYLRTLQKCHVIPEALGGPKTAGNLVLLCLQCHREAPNSSNPEYIWIWLRKNQVDFYDTYWTLRGIEEFERMFGRKPFEDSESEIPSSELKKALREEVNKAIVHGGEAGLNPATIACIMAEMEQRISEQEVGWRNANGVRLQSTASTTSGGRRRCPSKTLRTWTSSSKTR